MKAFDVQNPTVGHAHDILNLGYGAVGLYMRPDRCSLELIQGLHSVGLKIFSIFERGYPDHPGYFTSTQAFNDAIAAVNFCKAMGMPTGKPIFFAAGDYDSDPNDMRVYVPQVHDTIKQHGYLMGQYGNGATIKKWQDAGYTHYGYLSQSRGWAGYAAYMPHAAIIQGPETKLFGNWDIDLDTVIDQSVLW